MGCTSAICHPGISICSMICEALPGLMQKLKQYVSGDIRRIFVKQMLGKSAFCAKRLSTHWTIRLTKVVTVSSTSYLLLV